MSDQLQYNWKVFGQNKLLGQLERDIESGSLPHAILLTGPDKVGKFTISKRLAQILQCEGAGIDDCKICRAITEGNHLDTFLLEDDGAKVKIETVRKIKENMSLSTQSNWKIVIIQNAERMTVPAANSLLKILEEPPQKVVFLLSTSDESKLLDTIVSRCRVYRASCCDTAKMLEHLKESYGQVDDYYLKRACEFSAGHIGKAVNLLDDQDLFESYNGWFQELSYFEKDGAVDELIEYAEKVSKLDKALFHEFFWLFMHFARYKMISSNSEAERLKYASIANLAQKVYEMISQNVNKRLSLEVLFLQSFGNFSSF